MNREEFLQRCELIWDMGLATPEQLRLLEDWVDAVMRLEGGQLSAVADFLRKETDRTNYFQRTLANDQAGYNLIRLAAIFNHHCQKCATDPHAWHTRGGLCQHKD